MTRKEKNIKNNQELREYTEVQLALAWEAYNLGEISQHELMDIDFYYFENWVEPITEVGVIDMLYLN